jgi:hypothetical protein
MTWKNNYKQLDSELETLDFNGDVTLLENWQGFWPSTCYKEDGIGETRVFKEKALQRPSEEQFKEIVQKIGRNIRTR